MFACAFLEPCESLFPPCPAPGLAALGLLGRLGQLLYLCPGFPSRKMGVLLSSLGDLRVLGLAFWASTEMHDGRGMGSLAFRGGVDRCAAGESRTRPRVCVPETRAPEHGLWLGLVVWETGEGAVMLSCLEVVPSQPGETAAETGKGMRPAGAGAPKQSGGPSGLHFGGAGSQGLGVGKGQSNPGEMLACALLVPRLSLSICCVGPGAGLGSGK